MRNSTLSISSLDESSCHQPPLSLQNNLDQVIFHGPILKFPRDFQFGFQKERYLLLRVDGSLIYFTSEEAFRNDESPLGIIYLGQDSIVEQEIRRKHRTNIFSEKITAIKVRSGDNHDLVFHCPSTLFESAPSKEAFISSSNDSSITNDNTKIASNTLNGAGTLDIDSRKWEDDKDEYSLFWYKQIYRTIKLLKTKYNDTSLYPKGEKTVIHEGWMYHFSNGMGNVSLRYFVLTPHRLAYYFSDSEFQEGKAPIRWYFLTMDTIIVRKTEARIKQSGISGVVKDKLKVNTRESTDLLECSMLGDFDKCTGAMLKFESRTPMEASEWVNKITEAIDKLKLTYMQNDIDADDYVHKVPSNDNDRITKTEGWVYIYPSQNIETEDIQVSDKLRHKSIKMIAKKKPKRRFFQIIDQNSLHILKDEPSSKILEENNLPIVVDLTYGDTKCSKMKIQYKNLDEAYFSEKWMIQFDNPTIDKFYFSASTHDKIENDEWHASLQNLIMSSKDKSGKNTSSSMRSKSHSVTIKENRPKTKSFDNAKAVRVFPNNSDNVSPILNNFNEKQENVTTYSSRGSSLPSNSSSSPKQFSSGSIPKDSSFTCAPTQGNQTMKDLSSSLYESKKVGDKRAPSSPTSPSKSKSASESKEPMTTSMRVKEYQEARQHQQDVEEVRGMLIESTRNEVKAWSRKKDVGVLLYTLDQIWPEYKNTCQEIIEVKSGVYSIAPSKLKITYHKALKSIHPDKTGNLTLDKQILAQEIFIKLNEKWTKYTSKNDI